MKMKIKRIDKTLPLPKYHTKGAAAFDMYSRIEDIIKAGETKLLPTNLIVKIPQGYMLLIAARSGLAKKKGLKMANGIGIIDQDYCGEDDEMHIVIHNYSNKDVKIGKGERLVQAVLVKIEKAKLEEVEKMNSNSRGGFGSTG